MLNLYAILDICSFKFGTGAWEPLSIDLLAGLGAGWDWLGLHWVGWAKYTKNIHQTYAKNKPIDANKQII